MATSNASSSDAMVADVTDTYQIDEYECQQLPCSRQHEPS